MGLRVWGLGFKGVLGVRADVRGYVGRSVGGQAY